MVENTVVEPVQQLLFCEECGGWGTVAKKNPFGNIVITSCPRGCPSKDGPGPTVTEDPCVVIVSKSATAGVDWADLL